MSHKHSYLQITRYGCDSAQFPRLVTPNKASEPHVTYDQQRVFNVLYLLPPGGFIRGDYTPQLSISTQCSVKTLISIVVNSLPPLPTPNSIELFYGRHERLLGWYATDWGSGGPYLVEKWAENMVGRGNSTSIVVSVKVLDEARGCMVPFDPFPSPEAPPRVLNWTPACM